MASIEVKLEGMPAFRAHLARIEGNLDEAIKRGVTAAVKVYQREIMINLRHRTHRVGTASPSPPGDPPALVTGHLMRSVRIIRTRRVTAHVYEGGTGPTAVQSRIQEKGGWTGAGHRTFLPSRPYVRPAVRSAKARVRETISREIRIAVRTP